MATNVEDEELMPDNVKMPFDEFQQSNENPFKYSGCIS